jgi:prepilin-type N-terminal cleavage/methylation domain-containing protein
MLMAKKKGGFTLIEVLITIFILAVVLMTLVSAFIYGYNLLSRTKQVSLATQIAQEEIETIRNMPYDNILALGSSFTNERLSDLFNGQGVLAIEAVPGDTSGNIKKITASVRWKFKGQQMRKDIVTYVTREGINKK